MSAEGVIGAEIEVHRHLGPGLLESAYEECLCRELKLRNIPFDRQVALPVTYKGVQLEYGYRIDLLVKDQLVVELKSVDQLLPIHEAQLLTYLRLGVGKQVLFLISYLLTGVIARRFLPKQSRVFMQLIVCR